MGRSKEEYKLINCLNCHKEISIRKKDTKKFCNRTCYSEYMIKTGFTKTGINSKCDICGKDIYIQKHKNIFNHKFCGRDCQIKAYKKGLCVITKRKIVKCLNCEKEFEILNSEKTKFCSSKCYGEYMSNNRDIYTIKKDIDAKISQTCINCGKNFEIWRHRKIAKFCSRECHDDYRRDFLICPTCGNHFKTPKNENRKYCSESCAIKGIDKRQSKFQKFIYNKIKEIFNDVEDESYLKFDKKKIFCDIKIDNLIIECFGDYWHCNPNVYNNNYYHSKIRKFAHEIWEFDKKRIEFLEKNGYKTIVIWEKDFNLNPDNTINFLIDEIYKLK